MTLKAYAWDDEFYGDTQIVWAETAGKAKALIVAEYDERFTDVRVYRLPWADKYRDLDDIPAEVYLENGWDITCAKCGGRVSADTAVLTDTYVLCSECANKDR